MEAHRRALKLVLTWLNVVLEVHGTHDGYRLCSFLLYFGQQLFMDGSEQSPSVDAYHSFSYRMQVLQPCIKAALARRIIRRRDRLLWSRSRYRFFLVFAAGFLIMRVVFT